MNDDLANQREELLKHHRDCHAKLEHAIDGLTDEQMSERSLDGWSVAQHLCHLAFWDDLRAGEVERVSAGHRSAWRMTPEQDESLNDLANTFRQDLSAAQARWEMDTSFGRLVAALEAATPRAFDPSLYGEAGLLSTHAAQHAEWIARWRGEKGY